jgi:hypothetical protein
MQNAASNASPRSGGPDDSHNAIVSDLASLIAHVQASMTLIETAIARESPLGNQESPADVAVLDDVTPRYVNANAALNSCQGRLGAMLDFLMDIRAAKPGINNLVEFVARPGPFDSSRLKRGG